VEVQVHHVGHETKRFIEADDRGVMSMVSVGVDLHIAIGVGSQYVGTPHAYSHGVVVTLDHSEVAHCTTVFVCRGIALVSATLVHVAG
jgi:hypothetical protein